MRDNFTGASLAAVLLLAGGAQAGIGDDGQTTFVLANSADDFGGNQGENGWFYGFYDGNAGDDSFTPADFELMNVFDESIDRWWVDNSPTGPLTLIDAQFMHPNAFINSDLNDDVQWSVRRWVSSVDGEVNIAVDFSRGNPEFAGDGFILRMFIDGVQTLAVEMFPDNDAGIAFDLTTDVAQGSVIDFAIDPIGDALFDAVVFEAEITSVVPGPGVLAGLGLAGLALGRRRR
ncbi:MAG: hypothetical protein AAGA55_03745 [Planctomycetota bacterium]